uniref:Matrilin 2 n=1 Tax=Oncorhynchus kisutch TaxID=8019 RepID=A0A8C7CSK7_ONCKI
IQRAHVNISVIYSIVRLLPVRISSLCKGKPLDFVFIIDSSCSVGPSDYDKVKIFITNILAFLDVGPEATHVGLLQYGSVVQNEFSLNTYSNVEQVVKAMDHLATGTMTGLAIQYTMETAFTEPEGARPADMHIPRIAMIITDGRPQDTVEEVAAQARQAGIQIFAIGVGRVDMNTLRVIGSEPHSEHVYLVANFRNIICMYVCMCVYVLSTDLCSVMDHQCDHLSAPQPPTCAGAEGVTPLTPMARPAAVSEQQQKHRGRFRVRVSYSSSIQSCGHPGSVVEDLCDVVDHGCAHICANMPGVLGYECRCRLGQELNEDESTTPLETFQIKGTYSLFDILRIMYEFKPIYACFYLSPPGIDYCDLGNHGCQHDCVSSPESYVCRCTRGYDLNRDGKTCSKLDPCSLGNHGCEHDCVNTEDSFVCRYREGYKLRPDNRTCQSNCDYEVMVNPDTPSSPGCSFPGLRGIFHTCSDGVMDLVFVIDGSKSLGPANFDLAKQFVNSIVYSLDVSGTGTHVGLLQYSSKVRTEFILGQYTGITIYALGVGKVIEEELREIASKPDDKHLYYAEDFSNMGEITDKLKSRICKETLPQDMCKCENMMLFQRQVSEQLRRLTQNNILYSSVVVCIL